MDHIGTTFMTNHIARWISSKFEMDHVMIVTILGALITWVSSGNLMDNLKDVSKDYVWLLLLFVLVVISVIYYKRHNEKKYNGIRIFGCNNIRPIMFYIHRNERMFKKGIDYTIDHPFMGNKYHDSEYAPMEDDRFFFHDEQQNVKGYISSGFLAGQQIDEKIPPKKIKYVDLYLENGPVTAKVYYKKLEDFHTECLDQEMQIQLVMYQVLSKKDDAYCCHEKTMYNGPKLSIEERYKCYIKTYFGPQRDWIWKFCKEITYNPSMFHIIGQEARINLLLYGPPGTGKSSLAYRLARGLERHLKCVDLKSMVKTCSKYTIFDAIFTEIAPPSKSIILFEEFDTVIDYLNNGKKPLVISKPNEEKITYQPVPCFQVEDLLDILQGPMPIAGSIIIATSNKYEEMREICPALFRPGRLTPVKIDYMNWKSLQELTEHTFGKSLELKPVETKLIPSEILEYIQVCLMDGGFEQFQKFIESKMCVCSKP